MKKFFLFIAIACSGINTTNPVSWSCFKRSLNDNIEFVGAGTLATFAGLSFVCGGGFFSTDYSQLNNAGKIVCSSMGLFGIGYGIVCSYGAFELFSAGRQRRRDMAMRLNQFRDIDSNHPHIGYDSDEESNILTGNE